jgi:hypothetical protein
MNQDHTEKKNAPIDILIAFGEGPIKPVLLDKELTASQKKQWERYKKDPLRTPEPNFWCMESYRHLMELRKISYRKLPKDEKERLREVKRLEWQYRGNYALKRWGAQNAYAAGYALYKGRTKKVVLTGGHTIPAWVSEIVPAERIVCWPSEALLMKDVIKSSYGELYEKKYGKPIDSAIVIEDMSTNTLENIAYTINHFPELTSPSIQVGLLTARHHLKRVTRIAELFSVRVREHCLHSAQEVLKEIAVEQELADLREEPFVDPNIQRVAEHEQRWLIGLQKPQYLTYWLGYVALVKHPSVIQNALRLLINNPWREVAVAAFKKLHLNFEEIAKEDLVLLADTNPQKYNLLIETLRTLRHPKLRSIPPSSVSLAG